MRHNSSPSWSKRNNGDVETIFVCIMENEVMLLVNVKKIGSTYNMGHFCYQPIASRLGKGGCLILIKITRLK
jgi:hypothetical protein